jgi:hypothetical protein
MVRRVAVAARKPFFFGKCQLFHTRGSYMAKLAAFATSDFDERARIIPMIIFSAKFA